MSIQSDHELAVSRKKLGLVDERAATLKSQVAPDAHLDEWTPRSLRSLVNQLREEITRYTIKAGMSSDD